MSRVRVDTRKWPDRLHWQYEATLLGRDEHGTWLRVPSDTTARRGYEAPRTLRVGFVMLVPTDNWWMIEFYTSHPRHAVYVNIGTPPVWDANSVQQIDLDLDVVRNIDGTIELLDEDEFVENQVEFGYPSDLITAARSAAGLAVRSLRNREEPFGVAADGWIATIDPASLARLSSP
ncbi:MAG: DUF402 domain-containing protein [Actinomycetota bacterium]